MPSANNNTTQLGYGLGRDYSNSTSQMISREVTRTAIKNPFSDTRLQQLKIIVYKMVSTWDRFEKMSILAEYGETSGLSKSPSEKALNEKLTEALLIHLPPADLNALANQVESMEATTNNKVKNLQRRNIANAKNYFEKEPKSFKSASEKITSVKKDGSLATDIKNLKEVSATEKVAKIYRRQYKKLAKEVKDFLTEYYNKIDLVKLARRLDIDISGVTETKDLITVITNQILIYAAVLLGNTSNIGNLANSITNTDAYDEILQYTSYAYITGKPGLSQFEIQQKKAAMLAAKEAIKVRTKMRKERVKTSSAEFTQVSGLRQLGNKRGIRSALKNDKDTGVLRDASYTEIVSLAAQYGIKVTKRSNKAKLKEEIYRALAANQKAIDKITKNSSKSKNNNRYITDNEKSIRLSAMSLPSAATENRSDSEIPTIAALDFEKVNPITLKAVPVVIVGNISKTVTDARNSLPGMNLPHIKGNTKRVSTTPLSDDDLNLLKFFTSLPLTSSKKSNEIDSLYDVEKYLSEKGVPSKIIQLAKNESEGNNYSNNLSIRYLWLYGKIKGRTELCKYLETMFNVSYPNFTLSSQKANRKTPKLLEPLKNIANFFIATGRENNIKAAAKLKGTITNFEDLDSASKNFYKALYDSLHDSGSMRNALSNARYYGKKVDKIVEDFGDALENKDERKIDMYKKIAIYLIAGNSGYKKLIKYLDYALKLYYNIDMFSFNDIPQVSRRTQRKKRPWTSRPLEDLSSRIFNNLKYKLSPNKDNGISGINEGMPVPDKDISNTAGTSTTGKTSPTGSLLIDLPSYTDTTPIQKVVPVLVVNDRLKGFAGNLAKAGELNAKTGSNAKAGFVTLPMSSEEIIRKAEDSGHKITSKALLNGAEKGKKVKLKTDDLNFLIDLVSGKVTKKTENKNSEDLKSTEITETAKKANVSKVAKSVVAPVLVVNKEMEYLKSISESVNNIANGSDSSIANLLKNVFPTANTGATITKFSTGGTAAITGDAPGSNIFKNGARPELVRSSGNMTVTPLNKSSNTQTKQKVSRMTSSERNSALATGISSHIVKVNYSLPSGVSEVSNSGEAIKVYSVNPGITDRVDLNGTNVSLMELVAMINAQLEVLNSSVTTNSAALAAISSNTASTAQAIINSNSSSGSQNPFAGDYPDLDSILQGN